MAKPNRKRDVLGGVEGFSIDVVFDRYVGNNSGIGTAARANILKSYYGGFQTEAEAQRVYDDVCKLISARAANNAASEVTSALSEAVDWIDNNASHGSEVIDLLIRLRDVLKRACKRDEYRQYLDSVLDPRD